MKKKGYGQGKKKFISKNKQEPRRFFKCKSKDHFIADCPFNSDNDNESDDDKKSKKKKEKKEKNLNIKKKKGQSYCITWDSDASTDEDDDSDDECKNTKKKALASIALNNNNLSLFDSPSTCLMAKPSKVQSCDESDSDDDDDAPSYDDLMNMLDDANFYMEAKRKECKELHKGKLTLEQSFDELKATHERLMEAHEKLEKAHSNLEKAHSILLEQDKKEQSIKTCNIGVTCDILDESFYHPIVVGTTNPSCSTSTSTSSMDDGFTCDASLMVENGTLKKEVNELTRALGNAYGGDARLLKCLCSQNLSLFKEGLGYTPKKGKAAFTPYKTSFVKGDGQFCNRCKQVGHIEQNCKDKNNAYVSSIKFDCCYLLTKGVNGVKAKFIGAPIFGPKKKTIWVPKSLVTNLGGPKKVWAPKRN